jgi:hypothetical protein
VVVRNASNAWLEELRWRAPLMPAPRAVTVFAAAVPTAQGAPAAPRGRRLEKNKFRPKDGLWCDAHRLTWCLRGSHWSRWG